MTDSRDRSSVPGVYLGYFLKPHGNRGGLKARLFPAWGSAGVPPGTVLLIGDNRSLTVTESSMRDDSVAYITLDGVGTREEAEELRNSSIHISRDEALSSLEYVPLHMFLGMVIRSGEDELTVSDVVPSSANPLLVVEKEDRQFPVPLAMLTASGSIDWEEGSAEVELPKGLEDLSI